MFVSRDDVGGAVAYAPTQDEGRERGDAPPRFRIGGNGVLVNDPIQRLGEEQKAEEGKSKKESGGWYDECQHYKRQGQSNFKP